MNLVVEHSGRFVSYGFDTIVASITTDAVAADSITTASISSLEFHVSLLDISSVAGGRIRWVGTVASHGARGATVSARMALRWVSRTYIFILTLMGVMLNDQYS